VPRKKLSDQNQAGLNLLNQAKNLNSIKEENYNNTITNLMSDRSIEIDYEYKKNYNPYIQNARSLDQLDKNNMQRLQDLAFKDQNEPIKEESRQILDKRKLKFLSALKKSNIKHNKAILKMNPEHFFKITITGQDNYDDNQLNFNKKGKISRLKIYEDDDTKVIIGNESYNKTNQLNLIANKILKVCNVYHSKNKNNNQKLKTGSGKLMITNGLTVAEFSNKYGL
jgi:hypothetical protein